MKKPNDLSMWHTIEYQYQNLPNNEIISKAYIVNDKQEVVVDNVSIEDAVEITNSHNKSVQKYLYSIEPKENPCNEIILDGGFKRGETICILGDEVPQLDEIPEVIKKQIREKTGLMFEQLSKSDLDQIMYPSRFGRKK